MVLLSLIEGCVCNLFQRIGIPFRGNQAASKSVLCGYENQLNMLPYPLRRCSAHLTQNRDEEDLSPKFDRSRFFLLYPDFLQGRVRLRSRILAQSDTKRGFLVVNVAETTIS